jgi:hypothetical protein
MSTSSGTMTTSPTQLGGPLGYVPRALVAEKAAAMVRNSLVSPLPAMWPIARI